MSAPQPNLLDATLEFTRLAELPEGIGLGDLDVRKLRVRLMAEEMREYLEGEAVVTEAVPGKSLDEQDLWFSHAPDPVEIADGLSDIMVIAYGSLLTYFGEAAAIEVCREVWTSNLSKVDGSLGPIQRRADGKLLKPPGWTPPDIASVLRRYGFLT